MSFSELGLSPELLQAVSEAGYTTPTPIQQQAIPVVRAGRDVLGCAQTGTGKTASFTLPMIEKLASGRARARMPRSLILEPTRELAAQVAAAFELYGKHNRLNMALLIGGESFSDQERKLDRGVDVLIATPGRLMDLFDRGKILLSDVRILVIDEADRMLDMGFIPDVERIVSMLPRTRQTLFFSATMPPEIRRLADAFLNFPEEITVAPPASPAATVQQSVTILASAAKREALRQLIRTEDVKNAIVFCNRKRDVDLLFKSLTRHGFDAGPLHGDLPQSVRTDTLDRFKKGELRILVASDVAARGLDVQGLSHVFNFDVPIHAEDYVHRIGRTGRAGLSGRAFMLATPDEGKAVSAIEKLIGREIPTFVIDGVDPASADEEPTERPRRGRSSSRDTERAEPRSRSGTRARPGSSRRRSDAVVEPDSRVAASAEAEIATPMLDEIEIPAKPLETISTGDRNRRTRTPYGTSRETPASNVMPFPRNGASRPRRSSEPDDDRRIVGFGDHLPAFLARPARVAGS